MSPEKSGQVVTASFEGKEKERFTYVKRSFSFVTSSGEISNFLMENLERVLQLETIEKLEIKSKLET